MRYCVSSISTGYPACCRRWNRLFPGRAFFATLLKTVAGNWQGSPTSTTAAGLYLKGISAEGLMACAASSMITASKLNPGIRSTSSSSDCEPAPHDIHFLKHLTFQRKHSFVLILLHAITLLVIAVVVVVAATASELLSASHLLANISETKLRSMDPTGWKAIVFIVVNRSS